MPFPGREYLRPDRVLIRFSVGGAAAADANATARIVSQWGKDLADLPLSRKTVEQDGNGGAAAAATHYEIDLPLSSVARGEFLIAITAGSGPDAVRAFVPFRVTR